MVKVIARELFKLTRFEHAIMLAFAVFIAETIVLGQLPSIDILLVLSLLVPLFSEMGSFALNDYFDIETDRLNKKKDRPLVSGTLSPGFALWFSIICLLASTLFAFFINPLLFAIALVFNLVAVAYNWKLKDLPLVGNIYIATTMGIPFIFGNFAVSESLSQIALVLALLGFVAGLAREIIKSVQDMEGDRKARKSNTLPIVIGRTPALVIAILFYLLFIPLSLAPFLFGLEPGTVPLALVLVADGLILIICTRAPVDQKFARNASLLSFFLGMSGIFLASLA